MIALPCLKAQSNFLLGISGEEVLQPARQIQEITVEYPMETSDRADGRTMSGEASAPLPIRQPNSRTAPKSKLSSMISKRPEHLRMNLWQEQCLMNWRQKGGGRGMVSILQGETRLKWQSLKSQCHDIEHFGQKKIKHGF